MSARGRGPRTRPTSKKSRAQQVLIDYKLKATAGLDFASLATGNELGIALVDHSADIGSFPARIVKLKTSMMWRRQFVDERHLIQAVFRQTEGAAAIKLDDEDEVRNATQAGQFYRRPFLTHTNVADFGTGGVMDYFLKLLVLKNVLLDADDDLMLSFTNPDSAFSATAQSLLTRTEFWWKRV